MKKKMAILMAGVLAMGMMAGCGSKAETAAPAANSGSETAEAAEGQISIGYSCVDMNNTFQTYLVSAAQDKAAELDAAITVTDAQNDVVKQQDQVKALIKQGVDALIVVPADSSAMEPITDAAADAGIPLVYVNVNPFTDMDNIPENCHFVGSYEHDAGVMQGEMVGEAIGEGKVAILQGGLEYEATYSRTQGNKDEFAENYPNIEVVTEETADWQRDKAIDVVKNWLTAYSDLAAICANNDEMALGAAAALKDAGRTDVVVVGIDATIDGCAGVADGTLIGTVFQDSVGQGGGAVEIAIEMVNGNAPAESVTWIPYVKVTTENVADYQ